MAPIPHRRNGREVRSHSHGSVGSGLPLVRLGSPLYPSLRIERDCSTGRGSYLDGRSIFGQ